MQFSYSGQFISSLEIPIFRHSAHTNSFSLEFHLTSLVLSVLWNFTLNRKITFQSAANIPIAMLKVAGYYLVFTPLSTWGGDALTAIGWNEYIVFVLSMLTNFVTEYLFQRFFVFGSSIDTAKKAKA